MEDKQLLERLVCALTSNPSAFHFTSDMTETDRQRQRREILREACALTRATLDFENDSRVLDYLEPSRVAERELWERVRTGKLKYQKTARPKEPR